MNKRFALFAALMCLAFAQAAWGQWSSNASLNLPLADNNNGSDQVQPKLVPFRSQGGYVSWFDANPATPPPIGYDVLTSIDIQCSREGCQACSVPSLRCRAELSCKGFEDFVRNIRD